MKTIKLQNTMRQWQKRWLEGSIIGELKKICGAMIGRKNKAHVRVILKNGAEFVVKCDSFEATIRNNAVTRFVCKGCCENRIIHIDLDEIAAIIHIDSEGAKKENVIYRTK